MFGGIKIVLFETDASLLNLNFMITEIFKRQLTDQRSRVDKKKAQWLKKKKEREEAREARINFRKTSFWSPIAGAANDAWFGITFSTRPEFRSATEFFTLGQLHVRVAKKK